MGNSIEIPKYEIIVPNSTFTQHLQLQEETYSIPIVSLVHLSKYKTPGKEEVISLIRNVANGLVNNDHLSFVDGLGIKMQEFSRTRLEAIAKGDPEVISDLMAGYTPRPHEEDQEYIEFTGGIIFENDFTTIQKQITDPTPMMYRSVVEDRAFNRWYFRIKADQDFKLPGKKQAEFVMSCEDPMYDWFVVEKAKKIYPAVSGKESQVADSSEMILQAKAMPPVYISTLEHPDLATEQGKIGTLDSITPEQIKKIQTPDYINRLFPYANN